MLAKQFRSVGIHMSVYLELQAEETFTALMTFVDNCLLYFQTSSCIMETARLPLERSAVKISSCL